MNPGRGEFWVVEMLLAPTTRKIRTIVEIYRINVEGDIGFVMCGDPDVWWVSQFYQLDFVRKVELE